MPSERRLHPLSILFAVTSTLRAFLIPLLLLLFAARSSYELWVGMMVFPVLVGALVRYISYRYTLTSEELVIRSGLIFKNERHIPYSRIHNLASVEPNEPLFPLRSLKSFTKKKEALRKLIFGWR